MFLFSKLPFWSVPGLTIHVSVLNSYNSLEEVLIHKHRSGVGKADDGMSGHRRMKSEVKEKQKQQ